MPWPGDCTYIGRCQRADVLAQETNGYSGSNARLPLAAPLRHRRAARRAGGAGDGDPAVAAAGARRAVHFQHRAVADRRDGGVLRVAAARLRRVPDGPAARDVAAPGAERRLDARGAAARPHRQPRGRQRHRVVRRVRHRRQLRRRRDRVRDPDDHQLRRRHQGRGPHLRSDRALHPGRHARQADGDRRRSQRRPDHAGRSPHASRRSARRKRTSTARWTAPASSSAATRRPAS